MQSHRVFVLSDAEKKSAEKMGKHFYPDKNTNIESRNISSDKKSFSKMDDLQELVFLAHGSSNTYGGLDAKKFARLLADQIPKKKRAQLEHLHLVGCEIGLRRADGSSMAQDIANELANQGFSNVLVHAITQPLDHPGEVLVVEVEKEGLISAWLMDEKNGDRYIFLKNKNEELLGKISAKEKNELEQLKNSVKDNYFIQQQDPKKHFNNMLNTFKPNETKEERQKRLQFHLDLYALNKEQRDKAIELMQKRRAELTVKKGKRSTFETLCESFKKKAKRNGSNEDALEYFINKVNAADIDEWREVLESENNKSFFNNSVCGLKVNQGSTTATLVKSLSKGNKNNIIVAEKTPSFNEADIFSSENEGVGYERKPSSMNLLGKGLVAVTDKMTAAKNIITGKKDEIKYQLLSTGEVEKEKPVDNEQVANEQNAMREIKAEITRMIELYEADLNWYQSGCLSYLCCCFFGAPIKTKTAKLEAFQDLQGKRTLEDIQKAVSGYLVDDQSLVMKSKKTTMTRDALNLISEKCRATTVGCGM